MTPELWQRARTLFHACLDLDSQARAALLARECANDPDIKCEVESLLASANLSSEFLETPAAEKGFLGSDPEQWIGRRLGAYEIVALLAAGGMGEVYRGVRADGQYRQEVAIKLIRRGLAGDFTLARFKAEREILASLDHPNIARILDAGLSDSALPYFVMELIDGEPIDDYCTNRKLAVAQRLKIFSEVCAAVQYAHQHLVVHRDLKPGNILVTAAGAPKLVDFGIAKVLDVGATAATTAATTMHAMTPQYSSPEQLRGEPITTATDIYSLGVILYRLLTGQSPYRAAAHEPYALAREVCDTQPDKPSMALARSTTLVGRNELKGDLDSILLKALRKEPQRRYASASDLAQDLQRHLDGLPVTAAGDSWNYRAGKFVGRHKPAVVVACIVALATIIGGALIIDQNRIARAERQRAERRFNDVRQLANSMIQELDDSIGKLQGSTPARKQLVDRALSYLDALSQEAKDDFSLQRELVNAYQKMGDIQGNQVESNLGDTAGALDSYRKALSLSESLAASNPKSLDEQLSLASSYIRQGRFELSTVGNPRMALEVANKAASTIAPLLRAHSANPNVLEQMIRVYQLLGDISGGANSSAANQGDVESAVGNYRKALTLADNILRDHPDDAHVRRMKALLLVRIGGTLVWQGERENALENYRSSLSILQALGTADVSANDVVEAIGMVAEKIGNVQMMDDQPQAALRSYRMSSEIAGRLAAADPQDARVQFYVAMASGFEGVAEAYAGETSEGLKLLNQAIGQMEQKTSADPNSSISSRMLGLAYVLRGQVLVHSDKLPAALADFKSYARILSASGADDTQTKVLLAATKVKIAGLLARQLDGVSARDLYSEALKITEPLARAQRPPIEALYATADAYAGLGSLSLKESANMRLAAVKRIELLHEARSWLEQSVATWRQVRNPARFDPSGFETAGPKEVERVLAQCQARLREFGERASEPAS